MIWMPVTNRKLSRRAAALAGTFLTIGLAGCASEKNTAADGGMGPMATTQAAMMAQKAEMDPGMAKVIEKLGTLGGKPIATLSPEEARQQPLPGDAVKAVLEETGKSTQPPQVAKVENRTIPGPDGDVPVRVYTPEGTGPFPALVYIHGGGWVIASIDAYDVSARALAKQADCVVVSVGYRLAPEHPFPAAPEDCYAATQYVMDHAGEFGIDASKVAVGGESAGGNLSTVVCMMAKQRGGKMPVHQLLVYPVTDYAFDTDSYKQNAKAVPLNADMMRWFWKYYLKNPNDGSNPLASPLRATKEQLANLPPATVITDQIDPLRSEGQAYADKLKEAGVEVEYRNYDGVTHEFFGMAAVVDKAKKAESFAADRLKTAFKK